VVDVIAHGVFLIIILVVVLGGVETDRRPQRHGQGDLEAPRGGGFGQYGLGDAFLVLTVVENGCPVLAAAIRELPALVRGVDVLKKNPDQVFVGDCCWIVDDPHGLHVPGLARGHGFVVGIRGMAAGIAGLGREHSGRVFHGRFQAPEAASGEHGAFGMFGCFHGGIRLGVAGYGRKPGRDGHKKGDQGLSRGHEESFGVWTGSKGEPLHFDHGGRFEPGKA
jgi:hypothetical protein